ncbi:MAG: SAM-dependent methyltransferase [Candidatus Tectimicrobiota bacterium]|nr:MAG: SAM-dependent methyltransferase [Candidatus Tectomicrobia bacterium]
MPDETRQGGRAGGDAGPLHALALGFMAARTLHTALELRLFTHLRRGPLLPEQLAPRTGLAARALERLLTACAALGLVVRTPAGVANAPLAAKYLVEGKPTFIGSYLRLFDTLGYARWGELLTALRRNAPLDVAHPYQHLASDAAAARTFLAAQHAGSRSLGRALARRFDFTPYACLLDLGGGSGAYTIELLRHYPHLRAILFDFPQVCRLARRRLARAGLLARVQLVGGDYERDPLPRGADVVLWSGNLHASSPARCRQVLAKLRCLLPPGGCLLIHDYLLDDDRSGPLIPALLALHLLLVSEEGQVYSGAELRALLAEAGFTAITQQPFLPGHSSLVWARVPAAATPRHGLSEEG